ncbi:unnamed protein product [Aphis gossypii]|uniref:Uncharacterized protein n=1 Tax=Aphis gossypii TaxID=80765 RepID=A0A9P0NLR7_APHGO|nr:unnamed protein product [Aphis gossypii]
MAGRPFCARRMKLPPRCLPRSKRLPSIGHKPSHESVQTITAHFARTILEHDTVRTMNFIIATHEIEKNVLTDSPDKMHVLRGARQYGVRRRSTARIRCLVGAASTSRSRVSAQQQNKTKTSRRRRVLPPIKAPEQ